MLVGTIRKDGTPRISPNEPDFAVGRLFVSMMWRSKKALDLLRDPPRSGWARWARERDSGLRAPLSPLTTANTEGSVGGDG